MWIIQHVVSTKIIMTYDVYTQGLEIKMIDKHNHNPTKNERNQRREKQKEKLPRVSELLHPGKPNLP